MEPLNGRVFYGATVTSALAGALALSTSKQKENAVLFAIAMAGDKGLTDDECQQRCEMEGSTQRPRRVSLWEQGMIYKSDRLRRTRKNRWASVWMVTKEGRKRVSTFKWKADVHA